jgi:hypothetical protein
MAARKPKLTVVPNTNIEALDRVLTEAAQQMAPMVARRGSTRERFEAEIKALEGERDGVQAREDLARRHFEVLLHGFAEKKADIDAAIAFYSAGLTQDQLRAAE